MDDDREKYTQAKRAASLSELARASADGDLAARLSSQASVPRLPERYVPPSLEPENILRSIVLIQAMVRRKQAIECLRRSGDVAYTEAAVSTPALHVALAFCRRLVHPNIGEIEFEAMGIVGIICGRDSKRPDQWLQVRGLTLGTLAKTYEYYSTKLAQGHPVFEYLQERFREVAVDVEDDIMERIKDAPLPSIARAKMEACCAEWGSPSVPLGGHQEDVLFPHAEAFIARLREEAEKAILQRLNIVDTRAALEALAAAVERELGGTVTMSRGRVRIALKRHREHTESAAHNHYGWPPKGQVPKISHAARLYAIELGIAHVVVEDFAASVVRIQRRAEAPCSNELGPHEAELKRLRRLLEAVPAPPKLMADGYREELQDAGKAAMDALSKWEAELGPDSDVYVAHSKGILGDGPFVEKSVAEAERMASILRTLGPAQDPGQILLEPPEMADTVEERTVASVRLAQLCDTLHREGRGVLADALAAEFAAELAFVRPLITLLKPELEESDDDWHKPPGFEQVDIPYVKPDTPPPTPPPPPRPPTPPSGGSNLKLRVRLHGVTMEDVQSHSEILLMEKCAGIIAAECGIPREWVADIGVVGGVLDAMKLVEQAPVSARGNRALEGDGLAAMLSDLGDL